MEVINDSTRRYVLLDLLLINKEQMIKNVMVKDSLGYHKHDVVEFIMLSEESKKKKSELHPWFSEKQMLVFLGHILRIPLEIALESKRSGYFLT